MGKFISYGFLCTGKNKNLTKKMMKYVKRNFANFVLNIQSFFPLLGRVAASLPFYFFGFFLFGLFTRCICMIVCRYIWEITR